MYAETNCMNYFSYLECVNKERLCVTMPGVNVTVRCLTTKTVTSMKLGRCEGSPYLWWVVAYTYAAVAI